jgi:hypothetical protein
LKKATLPSWLPPPSTTGGSLPRPKVAKVFHLFPTIFSSNKHSTRVGFKATAVFFTSAIESEDEFRSIAPSDESELQTQHEHEIMKNGPMMTLDDQL